MKPKIISNIFVGLGLGIATIILHSTLTETRGLELTSSLLVLIGSVYYGFALLSKHKKAMVIEIIVASVFVIIGMLGLWISPWFVITGLFLHGLWDIAHHNPSNELVQIPQWYVPFCATYDWTIAIYMIFIYL